MSMTSSAASDETPASAVIAAAVFTVLPSELAVARRWASRWVSARGASKTCW